MLFLLFSINYDLIDSPNDMTLSVSDPFSQRRSSPPANPHDLATDAVVQLHLNTTYVFTCMAEEALPAAELSFSSNVTSVHNNLASTATTHSPSVTPNEQLFDSTSTLMFKVGVTIET